MVKGLEHSFDNV